MTLSSSSSSCCCYNRCTHSLPETATRINLQTWLKIVFVGLLFSSLWVSPTEAFAVTPFTPRTTGTERRILYSRRGSSPRWLCDATAARISMGLSRLPSMMKWNNTPYHHRRPWIFQVFQSLRETNSDVIKKIQKLWRRSMKTMSLKIRKLLRGRRRPARRQFSQRQQQEQPVKTDDDDDTKSTIGSPSLSMDSVVTSTTLLPVSGTEETPKDLSVTSTHDSDVFAQTTATPLSSDRWATASPSTDLSGTWKPIITPKFIAEYDEYLQKCGEGIWFRKVLLSVLSLTKEVIVQRHEGRELSITGSTPIGKWERTLVASGIDPNSNKVLVPSDKKDNDDGDYNVIYTEFSDPDGDTVQVEAWWEKGGSIHKSRLRNKPRLLGGEIETSRYLEEQSSPDTHNSNGSVLLVCESVFHPPPGQAKFQKANIVWRFQRV